MSSQGGTESIFEIIGTLIKNYRADTPTRIKLLDLFTVYAVTIALVQFVYCAIVGTFPFNAFLAGFIASIGTAVLTVSLRKQVNRKTASDFKTIVPERAFADYVLCAILLYFVAVCFMG